MGRLRESSPRRGSEPPEILATPRFDGAWMVQRTKDIVKAWLGWGHSMVHPLLRRRAHAALREGAPFGAVMFVCLGNVCRSPYAEFSFRRFLPEPLAPLIRVASSGFIGPGRNPPEDAQAVAAERSVLMREHESQVLTRGMVAQHDLIVVMEPGQRSAILRQFGRRNGTVIVLGDLDPENARLRRIRDPWGRSDQAFRDSFARIDRCLGELLPYVGVGGPDR
jgi:protein-tyrosine phosphatase